MQQGVAGSAASGTGYPNVMIIIMENRTKSEVVGSSNFPFFNSLPVQLTNMTAITHPSLPNYVALVSGATYGITNDSPGFTIASSNKCLFDRLQTANIPWAVYCENMGSQAEPWSTDNSLYAHKHNPVSWFDSVSGTTVEAAKVKDASHCISDLNGGSAPAFVFYTPNLNDDGHDTTGTVPDTWLQGFITQVRGTNWYANHGAVLVVWDEAESNDTTHIGSWPGGGQIAAAIDTVVASSSIPGKGTAVNHVGTLAGLLQLYGNLSALGSSSDTSNGNLYPQLLAATS